MQGRVQYEVGAPEGRSTQDAQVPKAGSGFLTKNEAKIIQNGTERVPKAAKMEPKESQRGPTKDPLRNSIEM